MKKYEEIIISSLKKVTESEMKSFKPDDLILKELNSLDTMALFIGIEELLGKSVDWSLVTKDASLCELTSIIMNQ